MFFIYYGITFLITNPEVDSNRYLEQLVEWANNDWKDYINSLTSLYTNSKTEEQTSVTDPFLISINYFLSRITTAQGALFGVFAFFFGFVYIKSISLLFDYKSAENKTLTTFYLIYFSIIVSIFSISGFRFWMASWIYFYGAYQLVVNNSVDFKNSLRFFFIASLSVLIHFSFLPPIVVLLIYWLVGNRILVYYVLAFLSFLNPLDADDLRTFNQLEAPESFRKKSSGYLSNQYGEFHNEIKSNLKWFVKYPFTFYFTTVLPILLRFRFKLQLLSQGTYNLYCFTVLFFAFTNYVKDVNQLIRFVNVYSLFCIALIIRVYKDLHVSKFYAIDIIGFLFLLLHFSITLRVASESINVLIFSPLPVALFESGLSLFQVIF